MTRSTEYHVNAVENHLTISIRVLHRARAQPRQYHSTAVVQKARTGLRPCCCAAVSLLHRLHRNSVASPLTGKTAKGGQCLQIKLSVNLNVIS